MAENKTQLTQASVDDFLSAVEDAQKREDSKTLCAMMHAASGEPAKMWGPAIVGFGQYHYKYASGREGDILAMGFSPRKQALSLYLLGGSTKNEALMAQLGKYKLSKGCLYIKRLKDVDLQVLQQLMNQSYQTMRDKGFMVVEE